MLALRAGWKRPDALSIVTASAVLLVASLATLVQSFVLVKLVFLVLFVGLALLGTASVRRWVVYPRLVLFYAILAAAGMAWAIVGLFHHGNHVRGITDALRLYAVWSVAFTILFTLLRSDESRGLRPLHQALVAAGILIALINIYGLVDQLLDIGLVSESMRQQLDQYIGIHSGYIQITSQNIGALFMIVPYLLALRLRADAGTAGSRWLTFSLIMALAITALSGRRALWLAVAFAPYTITILALATGSLGRFRPWARRMLVTYCALGIVGVGLVTVLPDRLPAVGYVEHLRNAFSAQDERSIQAPFLIDGFKEAPVLGSGFGAYAGYFRSELTPWTYELTYHQLLFNVGTLGTLLLAALTGTYLVLVIPLLWRHPEGSAIPFALLTGFCSMLICAYSNPYLRSFDYLFFVGVLPYLATFTSGFMNSPARRDA